MLYSQSTFTVLTIIATSLPAFAMIHGPTSNTIIHFSEGTGRNDDVGEQEYTKGQFLGSCGQDGIDKGEKPGEFDFVVFKGDDSDEVKLKLACKVQCKRVSEDKQAEFTFIREEPFLDAAQNKNTDIGKVWCDKVLERDESVWKKVEDVPLPRSEKI